MAFYMDDLMKNIHTILENVTIKYESQALQNETLESRMNADKYLSALDGMDSFRSYSSFDREALEKAGCNEYEIREWLCDKNLIPADRRDAIVAQQRRIVIRDYVELNPYYRTISGLPDIDDPDVLFAPPDYYNDLGVLPCPLFELPDAYINIMEKSGLLDTYKEMYPTKKYLNYLGSKRIDIYTARKVMNFGILRLDSSLVNSKIYETFIMCYESAREYYMRIIYNKDLNKNYESYNSLIGLCIMLTALNKLIQHNIQNVIERDLFDLNTIRLLYEAYNIPFVNKLPIEYHRAFVRNINFLLSNKSTDKVLIDLLEIFGYSHIQMFKYYLVKQHKKDERGNPIFAYKDDENGNKVLDYEKMFKFHFQTVNVEERNIAHAIVESHQTEKYKYVIADDPYWVDDNELRNLLYTREFNYIETKYIGINIMYLMTNKLYDLQYGTRMFLDSKNELEKFDVKIPREFGLQKFKIFDIVIALMCLLCKRSGFKGNVLVNPTQISAIKGFNFNQNLKEVAKDILANPLIEDTVAEKILDMSFDFFSDINTTYKNICFLYEFIVKNRYRATTLEAYKAYDELYNTLLITQENSNLFTSESGFSTTYSEYLQENNLILYDYISNLKDFEITTTMDMLIDSLIDVVPDFTNLRLLNNADSVIIDALIKLITYFKSYTTDIINLTSYYFLNDRADNILKLIDECKIIQWDTMTAKQYLKLMYDHMGEYMTDIYLKDILKSKDEVENMVDHMVGWKEILYEEHRKLVHKLMNNAKVNLRIDQINTLRNHFDSIEKLLDMDDIMKISLSTISNIESYIQHIQRMWIKDELPDYISDLQLRDSMTHSKCDLEIGSLDYHIRKVLNIIHDICMDTDIEYDNRLSTQHRLSIIHE